MKSGIRFTKKFFSMDPCYTFFVIEIHRHPPNPYVLHISFKYTSEVKIENKMWLTEIE